MPIFGFPKVTNSYPSLGYVEILTRCNFCKHNVGLLRYHRALSSMLKQKELVKAIIL